MSERVEKIRQQWLSAKPKPSNPAWMNSHHDIGVLLDEYDHLSAALDQMHAKALADSPAVEIMNHLCSFPALQATIEKMAREDVRTLMDGIGGIADEERMAKAKEAIDASLRAGAAIGNTIV